MLHFVSMSVHFFACLSAFVVVRPYTLNYPAANAMEKTSSRFTQYFFRCKGEWGEREKEKEKMKIKSR